MFSQPYAAKIIIMPTSIGASCHALPAGTVSCYPVTGNANGEGTSMPRLTGRKILITGGASGIGRATCALFLQEGASVVVLDRNTADVANVRAIAADVSDAGSVARAMQEAAQAMGGLDGLVNAAGVFINKDLMGTD